VLQISGSWLHVSSELQPSSGQLIQIPSICVQYGIPWRVQIIICTHYGIPYCMHIEGT